MRIGCQARDQRTVVRGDGQIAHQAALAQLAASVQDARRRRAVPQSQQQRVGVIEAQGAQGAFQAGGDQRCYARIGLRDQQEAVAMGRQRAQAVAESTAADAAPVEIVDALVEGLFHGAGGRAIAGSQAEAADFDARAAERGAGEGHRLIVAFD